MTEQQCFTSLCGKTCCALLFSSRQVVFQGSTNLRWNHGGSNGGPTTVQCAGTFYKGKALGRSFERRVCVARTAATSRSTVSAPRTSMGWPHEGILRFSFCAKIHLRFFSHDIHNSLLFSLKSQQFALFLSRNNLRCSIKSQWLAAFLSIHNSLQHFYQFTTVCSISLNSQQFAAFLYQLTMVCSEFQQFTTVCAFCAQNIKRVHDPWRLCKPDTGLFTFLKIWKMDIKMQRFKQNDKNMKDGHQNATFQKKRAQMWRMGSGWAPEDLDPIPWHLRDTCVTPAWHPRRTLDDPKFHPGENFPFSDFGTILLVLCSLQDKIPKLCKHWAIIFIQSGCSWFLYSGPSARSTQWAKQFACWVVRFHSAKLVRINAQLWHGIETCQNNKCIDTSTTLCPKQR